MLRFAPSPVDEMHIGHLRVAIMNWIVARQEQSGFILRIAETDATAAIETNDTEIKQILEKFALPWDHLLYQSESRHRHQQLAASLLEQGKAFVCTCTPEEIEADRKAAKKSGKPYRYSGRCTKKSTDELARIQKEKIPYVIRIKLPEDTITFEDQIKGEISVQPHEIDRFVILRADGTPTHDFACAIDDMLGGITTVIQEETHLPATPRQIHIRHQLGYDLPIAYFHLPAIHAPEGVGSIKHLLEEGFLPDAILNYLLLTDHQTPAEVFTLPEAMEWFDMKNISHPPVEFAIDTLRFLNREHIRRMDDKAASALYGFADAPIGKLVKLYLAEASTLRELDARIQPIFAPKPCEGTWGESMKRLAALVPDMPIFKTLDEFKAYLTEQTGLEQEQLCPPLRLLLTGAENGPDLREIYPLIQSYLLEVAQCPH